jgi:hypothetical protein
MREIIKCVAYYRMSADKQEASIDGQRTAVVKFAEANSYKVIREYLDEGISGVEVRTTARISKANRGRTARRVPGDRFMGPT